MKFLVIKLKRLGDILGNKDGKFTSQDVLMIITTGFSIFNAIN